MTQTGDFSWGFFPGNAFKSDNRWKELPNMNSRKKKAPFNVPLTLSCHFLPVAEFLLFLFSPTLASTMITGLPLLLYVSSAGSLDWLHICYGNVRREKWNEMEFEFKYFHFWNWVDLAICYTFRDRAVEICSCTVMAIHYCNLSPRF